MSGSDRESVYGLYSEQLALPPGVTAEIKPLPRQVGVIFKYQSGGSISIVGPSVMAGSTYSMDGGSLGLLYTLGTSEVMNMSLQGSLYLIASGATCVLSMQRLLSAPTSG